MSDERTITVQSLFGGCPTCGGNDGYVNAGKTHVFFCDEHRVSWIGGWNCFSSWRWQSEEEQREAYKHIEGYARINDSLDEGTWPADPELREKVIAAERNANLALEAERRANAPNPDFARGVDPNDIPF